MSRNCSRVVALPHVGQELFELLGGRLADLGQDAGEVALRVEAVALGAGDERPEPGVVGGGLRRCRRRANSCGRWPRASAPARLALLSMFKKPCVT